MAKRKQAPPPATGLTLPVAFGNLSVGDLTCRLGVTVGRANITVATADRYFCGRRLTGAVTARPSGATAGQESLPGLEDTDTTVAAVFDVKAFSARGKDIGIGLTFSRGDVDVEELSRFPNREGVLRIDHAEALPDGDAGEE